MKRWTTCTVSVLLVIISAACERLKEPVHIDWVDGPYVVGDDECTHRYYISVDDDTEGGDKYYWVGLVRGYPPYEELLKAGSGCDAYAPLSGNLGLYVDLNPGDGASASDAIFATAFRADSRSDSGNFSKGSRSRLSPKVTLGRFPPACWSFPIVLNVNGQDIESNQCINIDDTPTMPTMIARISEGTISGQADWNLTIVYTRSKRSDTDSYETITSPSGQWNITSRLGNDLRGGHAVLTCKSTASGSIRSEMEFWIRGQNPPEQTVVDFIDWRPLPFARWYYKYIAKHEGGVQNGRRYLQFNEDAPPGEVCGDMSNVLHTPNWGEDIEGPGGFGLFQLTRFGLDEERHPTAQDLWSWKQNATTAMHWLDTCQWLAFMNWSDELAEAEGDPVPDTTVGDDNNVTFHGSYGPYMSEANAMKLYNGLGSERRWFCEYDAAAGRWAFYPYATYGGQRNYYVSDVCSLYP